MPLRRIDVDQRAEGLKAWREGMVFLRAGNKERSEPLLRRALALLAEAFLEDRKGNANLFVLCHRIGVVIEENFGCPYHHDTDRDTFDIKCPIQMLHSRVGMSVAIVSKHRCSVCGAGDLGCDHEEGEVYDGVECVWERESTWIDHVAMTRNPDFVYTYNVTIPKSRAEIEAELGHPIYEGGRVISTHCRDCYGRFFAKPDDLDTSLWAGFDEDEEDDQAVVAAP